MQIDVTFEEAGEHIDVRFHSILRDPDAVRSVNGIKPDENGNVTVNSTCDFEQPKWGIETLGGTEEVRYCKGGYSNLHIFVTPEEYSAIQLVEEDRQECGDWEEVTNWRDHYDPATGKIHMYSYFRVTFFFQKQEVHKIPSMYLDLPESEQGEGNTEQYVVRLRLDHSTLKYVVDGVIDWETLAEYAGNGKPIYGHFHNLSATKFTAVGEFRSGDLFGDPEDPHCLTFNHVNSDGVLTSITVDSNGGVYNGILPLAATDTTLTKENLPANAKAVGDKLGDVATALDHIISMQEELIGV